MTDEHTEDINDVFERLHGDARTNPVSEEVMDVQSREALEEARTLVNHAIHQGWTTAADLARRTGIKAGAISEFRNKKWGKRKAGLEATVASKLAKAINLIIRERLAAETEVSGFVTTRLAQAIFAVTQYAIKRRKIAVVVVPAGDGKTMALQALEIETPGAVLITVTDKRSRPNAFLRMWARQLSLNETGRGEDLQDRISFCLQRSNRLILIDEAHKLGVATIDIIREVWDDTKVPIVMAATPSFYQTITSRRVGTHQSELMDQFYSRVGVYRNLTQLENPETGEPERLVTVEDIRKIYARGHVRLARDGEQFLCKIAICPGAGGLRTCSDLVQFAIDLYPGETITAELLRQTLRLQVGVEEAGFLMDTAEITREKAVAATA